MAQRFLTEVLGPAALAAQEHAYGRRQRVAPTAERDALGPDESAFIGERDSFYIATLTSTGWPYVQHRGGPRGFLRVLDAHTLAFADLRGNRQLVTTGNAASDPRASLILVDYPRRERLKILGHVRVVDASADPALTQALAPAPELRSRVERLFVVDVVGFDWNCPAYITPRYTQAEVEQATAPLRQRIAELEARIRAIPSGVPDLP